LVNLPRVEALWRPLTNHLLEVCHHPHIRMREWGVEAITYLVKAALQHKYLPPLRENKVRIRQYITQCNILITFVFTETSNITAKSIG
jgi:hypothetical protein